MRAGFGADLLGRGKEIAAATGPEQVYKVWSYAVQIDGVVR